MARSIIGESYEPPSLTDIEQQEKSRIIEVGRLGMQATAAVAAEARDALRFGARLGLNFSRRVIDRADTLVGPSPEKPENPVKELEALEAMMISGAKLFEAQPRIGVTLGLWWIMFARASDRYTNDPLYTLRKSPLHLAEDYGMFLSQKCGVVEAAANQIADEVYLRVQGSGEQFDADMRELAELTLRVKESPDLPTID